MASEAKRVAEGSTYRFMFGLPESEVEFWVQAIIIRKMIDGGWDDVVHDRLHASDGFYDTCSTQ